MRLDARLGAADLADDAAVVEAEMRSDSASNSSSDFGDQQHRAAAIAEGGDRGDG